jgi:hypothetical protein
MYKTNKSYKSIISLIIFLLLTSPVVAQKKSKREIPQGKPVLWEAVNISEQNLLLGPGGAAMKPGTSRITFIKEETGGWSKKYRIKDSAGRVWVAKIGREAQSETASARLIWALGYKSEVQYLVPRLVIPGKGTFTNVRLEARPEDVKRLDEWDWKNNPFVGTNELQGLKIMMAFLTNWDLKTDNNKILAVNNNGQPELHYIISDLGATLGKTGGLPLFWRIQRSRNEIGDYAEAKFISDVKDGRIKFSYGGKMRGLFDNITVENARWLGGLLSQLRREQIADAFRAANYNAEEVEIFTDVVKGRINELNRATGQLKAER